MFSQRVNANIASLIASTELTNIGSAIEFEIVPSAGTAVLPCPFYRDDRVCGEICDYVIQGTYDFEFPEDHVFRIGGCREHFILAMDAAVHNTWVPVNGKELLPGTKTIEVENWRDKNTQDHAIIETSEGKFLGPIADDLSSIHAKGYRLLWNHPGSDKIVAGQAGFLEEAFAQFDALVISPESFLRAAENAGFRCHYGQPHDDMHCVGAFSEMGGDPFEHIGRVLAFRQLLHDFAIAEIDETGDRYRELIPQLAQAARNQYLSDWANHAPSIEAEQP